MANQPLRVSYLKHSRWSITRHRPLGKLERLRAVGQRSQRLNSRPNSLREEYSFKGQRALWFMALSHARKVWYIHSLLLLLINALQQPCNTISVWLSINQHIQQCFVCLILYVFKNFLILSVDSVECLNINNLQCCYYCWLSVEGVAKMVYPPALGLYLQWSFLLLNTAYLF